MATRSPRRPGLRRAAARTRRDGAPDGAPGEAGSSGFEDVSARAARLGITVERVLQEYAHIAFADLRDIVEWGADGWLTIKPSAAMSADVAAAISEIVPGADREHSRVKLYDKKAALDAIARHLGMFPLPRRRDDEVVEDQEEEDPREFLARELARLAAGTAEE